MSTQMYRAVSLACLLVLASVLLWLSARAGGNAYGSPTLPPSALRTTDGDASNTGLAPSAPANGLVRSESLGHPARDELERALAVRPSDPAPLLQLAEEIASVDHAEGVDAYQRLSATYPSSSSAWVGLAAAYERRGDPRWSWEALGRALELEPGNPAARLLRGRLYMKETPARVDRALGEWKWVLEHSSGTPQAQEALRLLQLYEGR